MSIIINILQVIFELLIQISTELPYNKFRSIKK